MKASELDFSKFAHLTKYDWPRGVLENMDAKVIILMDELQSFNSKFSMVPSPECDSHVRNSNTRNRHDICNGNRLSDATDFFMDWDVLRKFYDAAIKHPNLGGLGLYFDSELYGENLPMVHIDCRSDRVMWIRHRPDPNKDSIYVYQHKNPKDFSLLLASIDQRG